jgi:hypothetical protein
MHSPDSIDYYSPGYKVELGVDRWGTWLSIQSVQPHGFVSIRLLTGGPVNEVVFKQSIRISEGETQFIRLPSCFSWEFAEQLYVTVSSN